MAKNIFLFSGQGSQYVGMAKELCDKYPAAKAVFDTANEVLGYDIAKIAFEGPEEELNKTANSQPAIMACSLAAFEAAKAEGITGEVLLQNLECRLDNVVFRLGIAPTRAAARQLVGHKHIVVDGKVVNIASFAVKPGMVVGVREKSKSLEVIENALAGFNHTKYPWMEWDDASKSGKFLHKPERADIPENIKEQLIVELYSK